VALRSDREVAKLLLDLDVDIAVDLKGHTQHGRPAILAYRPAPVQVSYLGYPATMGVDFIDYVLADRIVLPLDQQQAYSEMIVHLPNCYQINDSKREIAAEVPTRGAVGLPETGFVFCSFNNSYKLTPQFFDVWMRLLRQVEGSVLWLLGTSEAATRNLCNEASARGVESLTSGVRAKNGDIPASGAPPLGRPLPRQSSGQCAYRGERRALDPVAGAHVHGREFRRPRGCEPAQRHRSSRTRHP
jgi:hypothetical protein